MDHFTEMIRGLPLHNPVTSPSLLTWGLGVAVAVGAIFVFVGAEILILGAIKKKRAERKAEGPRDSRRPDRIAEEEKNHDAL